MIAELANKLLPRPACGERVGVRGTLNECDSWRVPLTRRCAPASPRKRGEVKKRQRGFE